MFVPFLLASLMAVIIHAGDVAKIKACQQHKPECKASPIKK